MMRQSGFFMGIAACVVLSTGTIHAHEYSDRVYATSDSPTTLTRSDLYTGSNYTTYTAYSDSSELYTGHVPDLPPSRTGQCYALTQTPATYRRWEEQVVVKPESTRTITHPARYETVQERQLVSEGHTTYRTIPARYETVTEQELVKPETVRYVHEPAQYRTYTEQVQTAPARKLWKRGHGPITKIDQATGEILCLVEEPAKYETVTRKEMVKPATQRPVVEPAQYRTVTKQIMVEPEREEPIHVPARYEMVNKRVVVEPERHETVVVPAEYGTQMRTERVGDPGLEWRPILCQTNVTPTVVRNIESALNARGYHPGAIDGSMDSQFRSALNRYQRDHGLPQDEYLNIATMDSLGVAPQSDPVTVVPGPPLAYVQH